MTARGGGGAGGGDGAQPEGLRAVELSNDHKAERADERRRVLARGGHVGQMAVPFRDPTAPMGVRMVPVGPQRVWDKSGT